VTEQMGAVILAGATGTVGRPLVAALLKAGYELITVSRQAANLGSSAHWVLDLSKPDVILPVLPGAILINCAAITRDGFDPALEAANLTITTNALRLTNGPVVHLSSSSAYDLTKPSIHARPEPNQKPKFLNSYSASKWATEQVVAAQAQRAAIILRPHAVYGDGDSTLLPRLRSAVRSGNKLWLPSGGRAKHAMTSIENLVQAVLLAVARVSQPDFTGQLTLNVTDANEVKLADAITAALHDLDKPLKIIGVPRPLAYLAAGWVELVTPSGVEPRISRYSVQQLGCERTYDLSETVKQLGFQPKPNSLASPD